VFRSGNIINSPSDRKGEKVFWQRRWDGHAERILIVNSPMRTRWFGDANRNTRRNRKSRRRRHACCRQRKPQANVSHFGRRESDWSWICRHEEANPADAGSRKHAKGELVADSDRAWATIDPLQRWTRRPGKPALRTPTRQAQRFAQPGEPGGEGEFLFELRIIAEVGLGGYPKRPVSRPCSLYFPTPGLKVAPIHLRRLHRRLGIVEYTDTSGSLW